MMFARGKSSERCVAFDRLGDFWRDEQGATAIEYAIIAAGIGGIIAASVTLLGENLLANYYTRIEEAVASVAPDTAPP